MPHYTLVVTKNAAKDIQKLGIVARKHIKQKLEYYSAQPDPIAFAVKLTNSQDGTYRWRAGHYRIVFDVDDKTIVLLRVQHRSDVYRK